MMLSLEDRRPRTLEELMALSYPDLQVLTEDYTKSTKSTLVGLACRNYRGNSPGSDRYHYWECAGAYLWAQEYTKAKGMVLTYRETLVRLKTLGSDRFSTNPYNVFLAIGWPEAYVYTRKTQENWDDFLLDTLPVFIKRFEAYAAECPDVIACERGDGKLYRAWFTRWQRYPDTLVD